MPGGGGVGSESWSRLFVFGEINEAISAELEIEILVAEEKNRLLSHIPKHIRVCWSWLSHCSSASQAHFKLSFRMKDFGGHEQESA